MDTEKKIHYFQFHKSLGYPVLIAIEDLGIYEGHKGLLVSCGFVELSDSELNDLASPTHESTVITLKYASEGIRKKLQNCPEESSVPVGSYQLYRLKNAGMLMYAKALVRWELAFVNDIGSAQLRALINQALSLALCKLNILSFWGVTAKELLIITSKNVSEANSFYIDLKNKRILEKMDSFELEESMTFARLELIQSQHKRQLAPEALYAFIASQVSLIVGQFMGQQMKEDLLSLARTHSGYQYPLSSFDIGSKNQFIDFNKGL